MTPEPVSESGVLVKVGLEVFKRIAPKGIAHVRSWVFGKELLVIGQPRAGKTTFVDYLRHGILEDEYKTPKTYDTTKTPTFTIRMGRDLSLELCLKRAVDTPGQIGPDVHAETAFQRQPDGLVIMLDAATHLTGKASSALVTWLRLFCEHYENLWCTKGRRRKNNVSSITIILNKIDKVSKKDWSNKICKCRSVIRKLKLSRGGKLHQIRIMPCILVTNPIGSELVDRVIVAIAKSLSR